MSPTPLAVTNLSSVILRSAACSHTPAWTADFLYQKSLETSSHYNTYTFIARHIICDRNLTPIVLVSGGRTVLTMAVWSGKANSGPVPKSGPVQRRFSLCK